MELHFNSADLRSLCNTLNVDYDDLTGDSRPNKIIELIDYFRRRGMSARLPKGLMAERPQIAWPLPGGGYTTPITEEAPAETGARGEDGRNTPPVATVLFMAANPSTTARIALDEEHRTIDERLRLASLGDRFHLATTLATRVGDISFAILRHKPAIVHFSGHGQRISGDSPAESHIGLLFNDALGRPQPVSDVALSTIFAAAGGVRLVVLNACWSDAQALAILNAVDCVIGMSDQIGDPAARAYAHGFYQALGFGKSIAEAHAFGCSQVELEAPDPARSEAHKPQLRARAGVDPHQITFA